MGKEDRIVVLDFGSQYTHLLARRIRELNVFSEILEPDVDAKKIEGAKGIILSGGPQSVYDKGAVDFNEKIFELGIPVLGLCYGLQLIALHFGGEVKKGNVKEYGSANLSVKESDLFVSLPEEFVVWMSHGDKVESLPKGFEKVASTFDCEFAAVQNNGERVFGLQFHPEVTHTEHGLKILENFVFDVCECKRSWTMENYLDSKIYEIQEKVGEKNVFLLLSGGVDSTVCLALLDRALGSDRVHALHIDTGLMRKNESSLVKEELEKLGISEVHVINAEKEFLDLLKGVVDPEEKREIIGKLFIDIAVREMNDLNFDMETWLLGQGTIYPDTIETGASKNSKKIKTHHNRVPLIMEMIEKGHVIEPLDELYKDEVRELGYLLGMPEGLVERHPFPGPGLAIRLLCSKGEKENYEELEKRVNELILEDEFEARVLPVKAVGVQGDNRTYSSVVMLNGDLDYPNLERVSTKITNAFSEINRVVYLVSGKREFELKEGYITKERLEALKEADARVMVLMKEKGLEKAVWQFPVILLPVEFGNGEAVVLRPVESKEAMTAKFFKMGNSILEEIVIALKDVKGIGAVLLDVTHKPPATIEWE